jgi:glutamate racemase
MTTTPCLPRRISDSHLPTDAPIVVYDSGVGGLTVARHLIRLRPCEHVLYVADNAWFPYGDKHDLALRARIDGLLHTVVKATHPRAVVIACNTASTLMATTLEGVANDTPLFLVMPPIQQAARETRGGRIVLLATPCTLRRSLVRGLIQRHVSPGQISLIPSMELVLLAERKAAGEPITSAQVEAALDAVMPCDERRLIEGVILGCTHFSWLLGELRQAFPFARCWSDPALDAAKRVVARIGPVERHISESAVRALLLTSDHNRKHLRQVFLRHGFGVAASLPFAATSPLSELRAAG